MSDFEFTQNGKSLKITFAVPKRTTRNDIVFHASDKFLIAGLRGKPAALRGRPLHALNASAVSCTVVREPAWQCVITYTHDSLAAWPTLFSADGASDASAIDKFVRRAAVVVANESADALSLRVQKHQLVGVLSDEAEEHGGLMCVKCALVMSANAAGDVGLVPLRCLRPLEVDEEAALVRHDQRLALRGHVAVNGIPLFVELLNDTDTLYAFGKEPKGAVSNASVRAAAQHSYRLAAATTLAQEHDKNKFFLFVRAGANFEEIALRFSKAADLADWAALLAQAVARRRWLALFQSTNESLTVQEDDWPAQAAEFRQEFVARLDVLNLRVLTAALEARPAGAASLDAQLQTLLPPLDGYADGLNKTLAARISNRIKLLRNDLVAATAQGPCIRLSKRVRWLSHIAQFLPEPNESIVDMDPPSTAGGVVAAAPAPALAESASSPGSRPAVRRDAPFTNKVTHAPSANAPRPPNAAPGVKVPARLGGKANSANSGSSSGSSGGGVLNSLMRRKQPPSRTKSELNMGLDFGDIESGEVLFDPNRPSDDAEELTGRDRGMSVLPFRGDAEPASSYAAPVADESSAGDPYDDDSNSNSGAPFRSAANNSGGSIGNSSGGAFGLRAGDAQVLEKPFACEICGARYAVESDVQFHKAKRHRAELELATAEKAALERKQQAEQRRLQEEKKRAYEKKLEDAKAKFEAEKQARVRQQREADEATERARSAAAKASAAEHEEARRRVAEAEASAETQRQRIAEENRLAELRFEQEQRAQQQLRAARGEDALSAVMSMLDDDTTTTPLNSSADVLARVASPAPAASLARVASPGPSLTSMNSALSNDELTTPRSAAQLAKEKAAAARAALEAAANEARRLEVEAQRLEREEAERQRADEERRRAEAEARARAQAEAKARADAEAKARAEAAREAQLASMRQRARALLDECGADKELLAIIVDETKAAMLRQKQLQNNT